MSRGRWKFRVFAAALAVVVTIGVLETALAVLGLPRDAGFSPEAAMEVRAVVDPRAYDVDPRLHWRMKRRETLDVPELGFLDVVTDARGLRGADRVDEIRRSRLRVVCMGDSVVFGLNLRRAETFPARLEESLRARFPADVAPVVVNAGVPGYSSVQGMRLYDELAPFEPDVVVWWFGMNDGKPALGEPDSRLRMPDTLGGGPMSLLRGLRVVRFAETLGADARGERTRVSIDEVRAQVAAWTARATSGGATTVFVKTPSRLDEKLAQLDSVAAEARKAGATRIDGAADALSEIAPGPSGSTDVVRVEDRADGKTLVLGPGLAGHETLSLAEVERRRDYVAKWKRAVDAYVGALPAEALRYEHLFGLAAPTDVFLDNCHLTAHGARAAAEGTALRIAGLMAGRVRR